jgi:hypothetical protein
MTHYSYSIATAKLPHGDTGALSNIDAGSQLFARSIGAVEDVSRRNSARRAKFRERRKEG